jgi:hypothetical protein
VIFVDILAVDGLVEVPAIYSLVETADMDGLVKIT